MDAPNFAETFERVLVPMIFRPWAIDLLDRLNPAVGERVLDLACGTGIVGRLMRERCGPRTPIAGVDFNPAMIAIARSIANDIDWHEANALELPFPARAFDLVVCQQGLQFFPNRPAAVREMRRVLADGGRVAISTWRPIDENPLFNRLHVLATARFGPHADRRFSCGDAEVIKDMLTAAGFRDIRAETVTLNERVSDVPRFIAMNLGATVDQLDEMSDAERAQAIKRFQADAAGLLAEFADGSGVIHPVGANVVTARA